MWLNSTAQNAIRAALYIAEHGADDPVRVDDIAAALRCPRNYLSKTLHLMVRGGVLRSTRGPKGGFQLVDAPERLSLARVVSTFEPPGEKRCLLGRPRCGGANPCPAHDRWLQVAEKAEDFFGRTTLADLLKKENRSRAT